MIDSFVYKNLIWGKYQLIRYLYWPIFQGKCYVLTFWPGPKCHSRWCTRRKWHIPMAVRRGNRVGGNWLMKCDEPKKFPWYTHRLMHRERVTSELHDSYFRLMTIKHAISKIEWALNRYITQLSSSLGSSPSGVASGVRVPVGVDVVGKPTPGRMGSREPWLNWGPEENEKDTTLPTITLGSKYFSYVRSPAPSWANLEQPFRTLAIKWEVYIFIKKFSCVRLCHCVRRLLLRLINSLRQYVSSMNMYMCI